MNALAHTRLGCGDGLEGQHWSADPVREPLNRITSHASWRPLGLVACWGAVLTMGLVINASLDFPAMRAQVAVASGALASAIVVAERWGADPDRLGRGCWLATLAGATSGWASLIQPGVFHTV